MPSERSSRRLGSEIGDKDGDQKHQRRHRDHFSSETPLANDSKTEVNVASNRKASELDETKLPDPTTVPRSRSYFQHDERGTAAQDGRRSGRRDASERGYWKNYKDDERATRKAAGSDAHEKEGKSLSRGGDNHVWRHDRFSEVDGDAYPPAKKRRQFREEKLPAELEAKNPAPEPPSKVPNPVSFTVGSERREDRARDRRPLERSENDRAYVRDRSLSSRGRPEKVGYLSRDSFSGGDNGGRFRGRDRLGGRQGYRSGDTGGHVEKWKHDMYDEANRSPTPKNEEDPVAKVEALLAL